MGFSVYKLVGGDVILGYKEDVQSLASEDELFAKGVSLVPLDTSKALPLNGFTELEPFIDVDYVENLLHGMCDDDLIYLGGVLNTLLRNHK